MKERSGRKSALRSAPAALVVDNQNYELSSAQRQDVPVQKPELCLESHPLFSDWRRSCPLAAPCRVVRAHRKRRPRDRLSNVRKLAPLLSRKQWNASGDRACPHL